MNITLEITAKATGSSSTATLQDSLDWTVLVNRLITKKFGESAARNRQDIHETEWPTREWEGLIGRDTYTIVEVPIRPALIEVAEAAENVREAAGLLAAAQATRDGAVRAALLAGVSVEALVPAAKLTRGRIYQIRDGRR